MKCRICGNDTYVIDDLKFANHYAKCSSCLYIGINENDVITFEEERKEYDRHENTIENEGYVQFFRNFLGGAVLPFINKNGLGLDFGSGPEPVLMQLMKRDYEVDLDYYDLHYQPEPVYEDKSYDFIISTEVIEHILNPDETFAFFAKHLKKDGVLSIMTLFHENDDDQFLKWWYRRDVTHISFFRLETFEVLAKKHGLEIIYTDNKRQITFKKI